MKSETLIVRVIPEVSLLQIDHDGQCSYLDRDEALELLA